MSFGPSAAYNERMSPYRSWPLRLGTLAAILCIATAASAAVTSCTPSGATSRMKLSPPVVPRALDLSSPEAAVRTYVAYTNFAYRMVNSDLASQAATPYEGVRVDSFIELNKEKDQGIEQTLVKSSARSTSQEGTRTLIAVTEEWRYRYFSISKREYTSPMYTASYDATYTAVKDAKGWIVDKVDANPLTPVN